ncbi:MAG: hypothetical protein ABFS23_09335 [Pseudomonadota bacterium]
MMAPVILIGVGEMGGVFARGFLRLGHPVVPVTRAMDMGSVAAEFPAPELVLVAVAEKDIQAVLSAIPDAWRHHLVLLQNELLPRDYAHLPDPTVISVWFEKKKGREAKVIIPSPVFGPRAGQVADALAALDIPARVLGSADELLFELVVKNLYILTSNIAGLESGGTVGQLWADRQDLARAVAGDVIALQEAMTGQGFDREALIAAMVAAFEGDPGHQCMGRSAPARLERALANAAQLRVKVPELRRIQTQSARG